MNSMVDAVILKESGRVLRVSEYLAEAPIQNLKNAAANMSTSVTAETAMCSKAKTTCSGGGTAFLDALDVV